MNYAALFAEIIIIGIQTSTWLGIVFYKISDRSDWDEWASFTADSSSLALVFGTAWLYTIGIIADRISDKFFWKTAPIKLRRRNLTPQEFKDLAVEVIENSSDSSNEMYKYYLSRVRIVRACVLNLPVVLLCLPFVLSVSLGFYVPLAFAIVVTTVWAYLNMIDRYFARTVRMYNALPSPLKE